MPEYATPSRKIIPEIGTALISKNWFSLKPALTAWASGLTAASGMRPNKATIIVSTENTVQAVKIIL
ncbi:hypothetical protein D3C73_1425230 [compost metagenome]